MTIQKKIVFSFIFLVCFIILIFASTSYYHAFKTMEIKIKKHGTDVIKTFSPLASTFIFENDYATLLDNARAIINGSEIMLISVMDISGKVWINTDERKPGSIDIEPFYKDVIDTLEIRQRKIKHPDKTVMEFVGPITALGKVRYLLRIEMSMENLEGQAAARVREIIIISICMIILAVVLGVFISRRITRPLKNLVDATNEISKGNLNHKINVSSSDEIGVLSESFNIMTTALQEELQGRKQAEKIIEKARDELEVRVLERTAELKKENEERLIAEEKYRKLMEASPVPIAVFDMQGNTIYVNGAFTSTFGWTLEELRGKRIDYVPDEALLQTMKMIELVKQGKSCQGFDTIRYNKQRDVLDVSVSFDVWRDNDGILLGTVVILHDVTKRKQLERQLLQSRKMEAIGTLAGGIAHDFNNILSGIMAYSQLTDTHIQNPEKVSRFNKQIANAANRAAELVQQILTFSRQAEYQKQPFELGLVVREVLDLQRSSIPDGIEVKEDITSSSIVSGDPTQMHQVVMNLYKNALQAMHEAGGIVSIKLDEIEIVLTETFQNLNPGPGRYVRLEIRDTGRGMDKKTLEKAFDPYFTTKEAGKGTGFGLALVRAIVEEHNGHIKADSVLGEGARFLIYLPVFKEMAVAPVENPELDFSEGGDEKIMIVDDDESIRTGLRELLEDFGYHVSVFEDGDQAYQAFKKDPEQFDLVITDMTMPKLSGEELAIKLLEIRKALPIILCTGYSENITEVKALKIGIRRYVQKPVSGIELNGMIREILGENQD